MEEDRIVGFACTFDGKGCKPVKLSDFNRISKSDMLTAFLRDKRRELGITTRKAAIATNMSMKNYCKLEIGENTPTPDEILPLAELLQIDFVGLVEAFNVRKDFQKLLECIKTI